MSRHLVYSLILALGLTACNHSGPTLTREQLDGVLGQSIEAAGAKLGMPTVVTNAGPNSVWWEFDSVKNKDGNILTCHVIFEKGIADRIKC